MVFSPIVFAGLTIQLLTLDQAVDIARQNHPQLRVADAQAEAARARADVQRAPLLPQVDASARYSLSAGSDRMTGEFLSFDGGYSYSLGVDASWLVWDHGRTRDRYRSAVESAKSSEYDRQAAERDIVLAVQLAFFDARARKDLVGVAREALENEERHLAQVGAFIEIGTRPEIDLARVRTALANARAQLIRAESDYSASKARLNQAMGITANTDYDVASALPSVPSGDGATAELMDQAVSSRPEFARIDTDLRAQAIDLRRVSRGLWPSVRVTASSGYGGNAILEPGWDTAVGVSLSWPLYDGHATAAATRAAELDRVILEAQKDALLQRVWLEIDEARLAVRSTDAERAAAAEALSSARELLRLAEGRYEAGVGNIIELGDAQVAVTTAAAQLVRTEYDLAAAHARLARAAGTTPMQ